MSVLVYIKERLIEYLISCTGGAVLEKNGSRSCFMSVLYINIYIYIRKCLSHVLIICGNWIGVI